MVETETGVLEGFEGWLAGQPLPGWMNRVLISLSLLVGQVGPVLPREVQEGVKPVVQKQGEDYCSDDGRLECISDINSDGKKIWTVSLGEGVTANVIGLGWQIVGAKEGCPGMNGGIVSDELVPADDGMGSTEETELAPLGRKEEAGRQIVVIELEGGETCEVPADVFFELLQENVFPSIEKDEVVEEEVSGDEGKVKVIEAVKAEELATVSCGGVVVVGVSLLLLVFALRGINKSVKKEEMEEMEDGDW
ncbi:hypothetical protein ACFL18_01760 [Patescibacteria group bacterium]